MIGIDKALSRTKVLVVGEFTAKPGQVMKKAISIVERTLIENVLSYGYELLNIQGTKTPTHQINFSGYLGARSLSGKSVTLAAKFCPLHVWASQNLQGLTR